MPELQMIGMPSYTAKWLAESPSLSAIIGSSRVWQRRCGDLRVLCMLVVAMNSCTAYVCVQLGLVRHAPASFSYSAMQVFASSKKCIKSQNMYWINVTAKIH